MDASEPARPDLAARLEAAERRIATLAAVIAAKDAQIEDLRLRLRAFGVAVGSGSGSIQVENCRGPREPE